MESLRRSIVGGLVALSALLFAAPAQAADRKEPLPKDLEEVSITEHLNETIPLDLSFLDERGRPVKLGDYFTSKRPVILTLNYLACPMLCTLTLNGMVESLKETGLELGKDYEIVTVSFHALEGPSLAKLKQQNYTDYWGDPAVPASWHFLTGKQREIDQITQAVGFRYKWIPETREYAHAAMINIVTPEGELSRYLYGITFDPITVKLSLVEASEGKIGSPMDQLMLYCYHYDSAKGAYGPTAMNIMRLGGGLTLLIFGLFLAGFWAREKKRRMTEEDAPPSLGGAGLPAPGGH